MSGCRSIGGTVARRVAALTSCLLASAVLAPPAGADRASLFAGRAPRPGPAILYARPARAPQLENTGPWKAAPIMVSGASAYRRGEFLYQDFLYDDHGAAGGVRDPGDPRLTTGYGELLAHPSGGYTYPTARVYAGNAADLVELRVKPVPGATDFRLTLNTLIDPARVAATLAIGDSPAPHGLPYGANVSAPARLFLTLHGRSADLRRADTGTTVTPTPSVRVDARRRQIELRVTHRAWDPRHGTVRLAAGVGLWDAAGRRYLLPQASADARHPGGAGGLSRPAAFFNVAFRGSEPFPRLGRSGETDPAWWRDGQQGRALARGDLAPFHAEVDFGKLARGVTDDSQVPRTGPMDRILVSHTETRQGFDTLGSCLNKPTCEGQLRGRLQPYALYVPRRRPRSGRYGLTLLLHSVTANYNQFLGSRNQSQLGERPGGQSMVVTPEERGPDGFNRDRAGADAFEAWADVARRYPLDPRRSDITGYSMGAWGTFKLAAQYPDLFARAQETVGAAGMVPLRQLASLRWVPLLMWNSRGDQDYGRTAAALDALGYRYQLDVFTPLASRVPDLPFGQHMSLGVGDQFAPVARFFGHSEVVRDPPRVAYVVNPGLDFPHAGTRADHAYWLSGLRIRRRSGGRLGTLDVRSWGFGRGDPRVRALRRGRGTLAPGRLGRRTFTWRRRRWSAAPGQPRRDRLDVRASNIASVTVDVRRARLTCRARIRVHSDGPVAVWLAGCPHR